ncbi:DUF5999 family protein [Kitasatospora sp. NPDC096128]|uniref:DUF5999 family protein n=1 Tax=Kitasatospora sp. NPDC096128 TaxID=3155547 RepID=UPI003318C46F
MPAPHCQHKPPCPRAEVADFPAAEAVHAHPEQGWSLLCNGAVLFDDGGALSASGQVAGPLYARSAA